MWSETRKLDDVPPEGVFLESDLIPGMDIHVIYKENEYDRVTFLEVTNDGKYLVRNEKGNTGKERKYCSCRQYRISDHHTVKITES